MNALCNNFVNVMCLSDFCAWKIQVFRYAPEKFRCIPEKVRCTPEKSQVHTWKKSGAQLKKSGVEIHHFKRLTAFTRALWIADGKFDSEWLCLGCSYDLRFSIFFKLFSSHLFLYVIQTFYHMLQKLCTAIENALMKFPKSVGIFISKYLRKPCV